MARNHAAASHYVVVHTAVDGWQQGDVIKADDEQLVYEQTEQTSKGPRTHKVDKTERLLSLGAIRPATDEEAAAGKGFGLGVPGLSQAAQLKLATLDAELHQLRGVLAGQRARLESYERQGVKDEKAAAAVAEAPPDPLIEQRRSEVEALRKQAAENDARLQELLKKGQEPPGGKAPEVDPEATGSAPLLDFGESGEGGHRRGRHKREET